ncbi:MAG: LysR family transcriptional regulator [Defluviitaleaceae bacterium]|nr:LysR family transcriptional regulator [Defluviitaleaceae bacterium]
MDIKNLEYFVEIVNSKYNMSVASKKLNISQPALSAIIRNFEIEENILLFERYSGRLQNLTPSGEILYKNSLILIENYNNMLSDLRESSVRYKGKVRIGIPPLILSVCFSDILPTMMLNNPDIEFEIVEMGAYELRKLLVSKNLDFAVLLQPIDISPGITNEYQLQKSELTAFMSSNNPLAQEGKIFWSQMHGQPIAIFDNTFMIHHHLMDQFRIQGVHPKISIMSSHWDYLLFSTKSTDLVAILPSPINTMLNVPNVVERHFDDPVSWRVILHQPKKSRYSHLEKYVLKLMLDYFNNTDK